MNVPLDRENTVLGSMIMNMEGAILQSSGGLENNESFARALNKCLKVVKDYKQSEGFDKNYHRISFVFSDRAYSVIKANQQIRVLMKKVTEAPTLEELTEAGE